MISTTANYQSLGFRKLCSDLCSLLSALWEYKLSATFFLKSERKQWQLNRFQTNSKVSLCKTECSSRGCSLKKRPWKLTGVVASLVLIFVGGRGIFTIKSCTKGNIFWQNWESHDSPNFLFSLHYLHMASGEFLTSWKIWPNTLFAWNCLISSLCSHRTDEPGWILTFVGGFYHLPLHRVLLWQIQNGVSKLSSTHPCHHVFAMQKLRWLSCSHGCVNFVISAKILTSSTSRKIIWCHVNISTGNIGLLWTINNNNKSNKMIVFDKI